MYDNYTINDCCCNYSNYINQSLNNLLGTYLDNNVQKIINVYNSLENNLELQRLRNQVQSLETNYYLLQQTKNLNDTINNSFLSTANYMSMSMAPIYTPNCFCYSPLDQNINQIEYKEEKKEKRLTIEELDLLLFPDNPIREWSEKEIKKIEEKYKWVEKIK